MCHAQQFSRSEDIPAHCVSLVLVICRDVSRELLGVAHGMQVSGGSRGGAGTPPPLGLVYYFFSTIISALALTSIVYLLSM